MGRAVAVLGLGGMGSGIAHTLVVSGFDVAVHNRTASRAAPLAAAGATVAATAADAVTGREVVVLSLADEPAVEQVLFTDLAGALVPGTTVVDTSTVSPAFARRTADRLAAIGVARVEACLIGNPPMARAGALRVFTAGEPDAVDGVADVLGAIGHESRHLGPTGRAGSLKLAFNLLLGVQTAALAETVGFAESAGIDRELLLTALDNSGWRSPVLSFRSEFMRSRVYRPAGFRATLMQKDLRLADETATEHGVTLPLTRLAADRFGAVISAGRGDDDAAAVVDVPSRAS